MRRARVAALAAFALAVSGAHATPVHGPAVVEPEAPAIVVESGPIYAAPTRDDRIGRVLAPVMVNGQGPFRFLVDTGANRTSVSARLAARLALPSVGGEARVVHGVTGAVSATAVRLESVAFGPARARDHEAPVLDTPMMADADGILGMDLIGGRRLFVDFLKDRVELRYGGRAPPHGWVRAEGALRSERILVANATVNGRRVAAVIDTGAERSVANEAFAALLTSETADREFTLYGAAPEGAAVRMVTIENLAVGGVTLKSLAAVRSDAYVFRYWGLESTPTILIGMDVLGQADAMAIDFVRAELQLLLPRDATLKR